MGLDNLKDKRALYKEFQLVERILSSRYFGWIAYTKLNNLHMIRIFKKIGAKPFDIDINHNNIWFYKRSKRNENTKIR